MISRLASAPILLLVYLSACMMATLGQAPPNSKWTMTVESIGDPVVEDVPVLQGALDHIMSQSTLALLTEVTFNSTADIVELDSPIIFNTTPLALAEPESTGVPDINFTFAAASGGKLTLRCRKAPTALQIRYIPEVRVIVRGLIIEGCREGAVSILGDVDADLAKLNSTKCKRCYSLDTLQFTNNAAKQGGALRVEGALLQISGSTFFGNSAEKGGAIYVGKRAVVLLNNATFTNNSCPVASHHGCGALNDESPTGGAVHVHREGCLTSLGNSILENNTAEYGGGLMVENFTDWCASMVDVASPLGQGKGFVVVETQLVNNKATCDGGAIHFRQSWNITKVRLNRFDVTSSDFIGNQAGGRGGALWVEVDQSTQIHKTTHFTNNSAVVGGGALFFTTKKTGFLLVDQVVFENNSVSTTGKLHLPADASPYMVYSTGVGGAVLLEADYRGEVEVNNSHFLGNQAAFQGGAMAIYNVARVVLRNGTFVQNSCLGSGGALAMRSFHGASDISQCKFEDNSAGTLPDLRAALWRQLPGRTSGEGPHEDLGLWLPWLLANITGNPLPVGRWLDVLLGHCGLGGGGGACVQNTGELRVAESEFLRNAADFGGGAFFETSECMDMYGDSMLTGVPPPYCKPRLMGGRNIFDGNTAELSGADVFLTREVAMPELVNCTEAVGTCPRVASRGAHLVLTAPGDVHFRAEEQFSLNVALQDSHGHPVNVLDTDVVLQVDCTNASCSSREQVLRGRNLTVDSRVNLTRVAVYGKPGQYTLTVVARKKGTESLVAAGEVQVQIRSCRAGEVRPSEGDVQLCTPCGRNLYSFSSSNQTCDDCPPNANCLGGAIIFPKPGYWHSHPRSPLMHRCPLLNSCAYNNNNNNNNTLSKWQLDHWEQFGQYGSPVVHEEALVGEYSGLLCAPGYEGIACGSCSAGWARARLSCSRCHNLLVSWILFVLARMFEVIWIGGLVWLRFRRRVGEPLKTAAAGPPKESLQGAFVVNPLHTGAQSAGPLSNEKLSKRLHYWSHTAPGAQAPPQAGERATSEDQGHRRALGGAPARDQFPEIAPPSSGKSSEGMFQSYLEYQLSMEAPAGERAAAHASFRRRVGAQTSGGAAGDGDVAALLPEGNGNLVGAIPPPALWMLPSLTVLKALISRPASGAVDLPSLAEVAIVYFQMMGTLSRLAVPWKDVVTQAFTVLNLSGTSLTWASVACLIPEASPWSKAVTSSSVSFFTPVALSALLIVAFFLFRPYIDPGHKVRNYGHEVTMGVTAQATIFYYSSVSIVLVSLFSCNPLDPKVSSLPYSLYLKAYARWGYWTQEYSTTCWGASRHALLASLLGVPGILIFSLGLPLGFFFFLNKNKDRLQTTGFKHIYGVLYDAFRPQTYYWQLVSMFQLLLLVIVAEILQTFGPFVQLVCYMAVVTLVLAAQLAYYPMASIPLNGLLIVATYAPLVSAYLGLSFLEERNRTVHRVAIILILVVNAMATLLLLLHALYCCTAVVPLISRTQLGRMIQPISWMRKKPERSGSSPGDLTGQGLTVLVDSRVD